MSRPGRGVGDLDPARLETAVRELHSVARRAAAHADALQNYGTRLDPITSKVCAVIGGTASGTDKKMVTTLTRASKDVAGAAAALWEAARTADRLAREAAATAEAARRERAERGGR